MPARNTIATELHVPRRHKTKRTTYMIGQRKILNKGVPVEPNRNQWIKYLIGAGVCLFVTAGIILAGLLPALLISLNQSSTSNTTATTTINSNTNTNTNTNAGVSTTVVSTGTATIQQGSSASTISTTGSPSGFSISGSIGPGTTQYYGAEDVSITCTVNLANFTGIIIVQKTVNATYRGASNNFWTGVMSQSYVETATQIIYTWTINSGQTVNSNGGTYTIEAQFYLTGIYQNTSLDTYQVTATTVTGLTNTMSGHF